jgi:peroxiredoxin Q/BCP
MVCTKQFCSYRDRADDFAALDATVVGISAQDLDSHRGFIEKNSLTVPLLSDVDKAVAKAYSAFSSRLGIKRAVIVIDEQGVVRHRHDHLLGLDYQSVDDLKAALDALPRAGVNIGELGSAVADGSSTANPSAAPPLIALFPCIGTGDSI